MSRSMRLLNVKVPDDLRALVEKAAQVSGAKDLSSWVREALEAGARAEISVYETQQRRSSTDAEPPTQPPSRITLRGVHRGSLGRVSMPGCTHPPTARYVGVESETCTLCGAVVRRRL